MSDAPTDADHRRIRRARRQARAQVVEIDKARKAAVLAAFRAEIGATVRSASPLLISLLARDGLTLDDAMALVEPVEAWPRYPRLSGKTSKRGRNIHLMRYHLPFLRPTQLSAPPLHGHSFDYDGQDYLLMQIVDHSLDLNARIGPVWLETRFGELRVEFDDVLPETIFTGCVGRTIGEIVDHEAWRGLDWRIVDTEDGFPPIAGQTLIVATGTVPHQVTWPATDLLT